MITQDNIQQYYHHEHESFLSHVKAVIDALEKILELRDDQVTNLQKAEIRGLKSLYNSQQVKDIENDLASGNVSMETVEKRVQLEEDACKAVIELLNPTATGKIFHDLLVAEHINAMRRNLKNMVLLVSGL